MELSEVLNRLPIHSVRPDQHRFRNANGVYMKLCNFLRFDPSYTGKGLSRGGADEETVVAALLHDIGVPFSPDNHDRFAAEILRPYVGWETYWLVQHHGIFQGYYYFHHVGKDRKERERYRGHPVFEKAVEFCEKWDQAAFDPNYDTMPLSAFEPMAQRIFARDPWAARTIKP